jgi:hypothetical protein
MPSVEFLQAFAAAWNRHDIDAIMMYMAEDGVFVSSSGELRVANPCAPRLPLCLSTSPIYALATIRISSVVIAAYRNGYYRAPTQRMVRQ